MKKIVFIGAGSIIFAKNILVDILSFQEFDRSTFSFMDVDKDRLEKIVHLANKIVCQENYMVNIEAYTDQRQAMEGSDYVIVMFQIGGLEAYTVNSQIKPGKILTLK